MSTGGSRQPAAKLAGAVRGPQGTKPEDRLEMAYPASWWRNMWREALPSGNGVLGASMFGGVQEETVLLNHGSLWHWGHRDEVPDVSESLAQTRALMDAKRYLEASWVLANALKKRGYGTRLASRFPLGAIRLSMPCAHAFRSYSRTLLMDTGEVEVAWTDGPCRYRRRLFVSRADDAVVYAVEASPGHDAAGEIGLVLQPSDRFAGTAEFKELEQSVETGAEGGYAWYAARNDDGTDFGAVLLVVPGEGTIAASAEKGTLRFQSPGQVLVLVKAFAGGARARDWPRLKGELEQLSREAPYEALLERHLSLHRPLYCSASLELEPGDPEDPAGEDRLSLTNERLLLDAYQGEAPNALIRRLWAYGRYLFISGTSAGEEAAPFGLYGLWGGDYRLVWSHHMANENIQMMYWHAHTGGLGSLCAPLFRYYEGLLEDFRSNARKLYGCRGIYIPAGTTPGAGVPNQIVPVILNWTGAAGWLARHYYEHFRYTGDLVFLEEQALPFMREALAFYKDFAALDENGYYKLYPSVSPENTPQNYMPEDGRPLAHPMPTAINATMEVAILRELLSHLIQAGQLSDSVSPEETTEWQDMLGRLPPYRINQDGAVSEWIHPDFADRYAHRHLSHLYPVFPGHEITREHHPQLFEAFRNAVHKREIGAQSGWSLAHMAAVYARLGEGDQALECLDILTRSSLLPNLFTLHNDWRGMGVSMSMPTAPVQLDANMGIVHAVQEMLLQSPPGLLKLLPALPQRWRRGRIGQWRFCTGRIWLEWDRDAEALRAEIVADRDTDAVVRLPDWARPDRPEAIMPLEPSPLGPLCYKLRLRQGDGPVIISL